MTDKYIPTQDQRVFVGDCARRGDTLTSIAAALNIHRDTVKVHFEYELLTNKMLLANKAVNVLDEALGKGSVDAAKFVLTKVGGDAWKDKVDVNNIGDDVSRPPPTIIFAEVNVFTHDK